MIIWVRLFRLSRTSLTLSKNASLRVGGCHDVVLVEIGGTVGDIESLPFPGSDSPAGG